MGSDPDPLRPFVRANESTTVQLTADAQRSLSLESLMFVV